MPRPSTLPVPTHEESKEESVRISDEYKAARGAAPSKREGRKMIKGAYKMKEGSHDHETAERDKLRHMILSLRLFPNLFNREFLLRAQGPN